MAIELITKYIPLLDEVWKQGLKTTDLNMNMSLVLEAQSANEVKIPKIDSQALADYDRATGFVAGTSSLVWETHTFTQDRGRSIQVDNADNLETAGVAFGALGGDFMRTKVVPETDAYRFAKMAAGGANTVAADLTSSTVDKAIIDAETVMDDANVPEEGRILYVSNEVYGLIQQSDNFSRQLMPGNDINTKFEFYNNMKVVKVPRTRFYSEITLYDGTTGGQENGGYIKTAVTGKDLNFMIVHPSAVVPAVKLSKVRVFTPDGEGGTPVTENADAYKFQMRLYHDLWVLENKVDGIYTHTKA